MANLFYNAGKVALWNGSIDLDTDTIKVMLVTSAYTPDKDAHTSRADVTNEVGDSGTYAAGGAALASKTVTQDDTNDRAKFDATDLAFTSATITANAAVLYKSNGGAASGDPLIAYIELNGGSDVVSTAGTFTVPWHADGIFYY